MAVRLSILSDFAIQALKANKMRSFLTMLGIIIGVGAVVLMMAIGQGEQQQVAASLSRLGTNLLQVMPSFQRGGVRTTTTNTMTLGMPMPSPICPAWRRWPRRCGRAAW